MEYIGLQLIAVAFVTACACNLLGVFWVLRRGSFQGDAVAHSVLFGVVMHFLLFNETKGFWMYVSATFSGFLCLFISQYIVKKKWLLPDTAIAFSLAAFFAAALVLIALFAGNVHLDTDSAMLGELVFVVFNRLIIIIPEEFYFLNIFGEFSGKGFDVGPQALYVGLSLFLFNLSFVVFFYKPLQIRTFELAYFEKLTQKKKKGSSVFLDFALVVLTSVSAVLALEVVGVVLSVSFFVVPVVAAFLLTSRKLWAIFPLACFFSLVGILLGYVGSAAADVSIAGSIAVAMGVVFLAVFLLKNYSVNTNKMSGSS